MPLFLAVLLDEQSVEQRMKELEESFSDLVDQAYKALLEGRVNKDVHSFRSIFLSLNVSRKHLHQKFIQDNLKIDEETTFDDLWTKLAFYWNFLNFDLLEHVINKFRIENLKHRMESYKDDLQSFRKATRLCVFVNCWPLNGEIPPETEFREFVTKIKLDWENCTLEDIETKKRVFIRKFLLPEYALQPGEIKKGCIAITWLVPAPFVNALQEAVKTTSSDFFLEHKIETITIDRKVCHPSPSRKHVDYPKEQFTSHSIGEAQREKSPLGVLPKKLQSFESPTSEEQPPPKRMRLAEEILSGQSMSMVPSEKLSIHPGDVHGEKSTPSFLKQTFGIQVPPKPLHKMRHTSGTDTPTPDEMEALSEEFPKPHTHLGGTIPRTGYRSSRVPSSFDIPTLEEMEELSLMPKPHTHLGGTTTTPQHPAQEHTGMHLVIVWYCY